MNGSCMIAHGGKLFRLVIGRVMGIEDGLSGPDADEAIYRVSVRDGAAFH